MLLGWGCVVCVVVCVVCVVCVVLLCCCCLLCVCLFVLFCCVCVFVFVCCVVCVLFVVCCLLLVASCVTHITAYRVILLFNNKKTSTTRRMLIRGWVKLQSYSMCVLSSRQDRYIRDVDMVLKHKTRTHTFIVSQNCKWQLSVVVSKASYSLENT